MSLDEVLDEELAAIDARGLRRRMREVSSPQRACIEVDGKLAVNFSANNYLGLADHPALLAAARGALSEEGFGAGAARLIAGNLPSHRRVERELAEFHGAEAALLFTSGYQANVGVLSALASAEDVIFSDELNHASLIDGCRLARAARHVYRHRDLEHLAQLLEKNGGRRRYIVSDSLFSMDGDLAPVAELRALADRSGAFLVLDEAHATGVIGPGGRGVAAAAGVRADVHLATLSKAVGAFGAYVAGSRALIEFLVHAARSFVFTTALPPSVAAAARAGLEIVASAEGERRRALLRENIERFRSGLAQRGLLARAAGRTPIFPIVLEDERRTLAASERLLARGVYAQGIRPPTVPPGTSRLRFALMATHTAAHIDQALAALDDLP